MAIAPTPTPTYPNVPNASGVPPVLRQANSVTSTIVGLAADAASIVQMFQAPKWGLYTTSGQPVLASSSSINQLVASLSGTVNQIGSLFGLSGQAAFAVSVGSMDIRQDYRVSTAPQEQGAFLSYNKVQVPFDGRVNFLVGGTEAQRAAFLSTVQGIVASMDLYSLVMPDATFPSVNATHFDLRRTAERGVSLLSVDVWVEQIRESGTTAYSSSNPSSANAVNVGSVQPVAPTSGQSTPIPAQLS